MIILYVFQGFPKLQHSLFPPTEPIRVLPKLTAPQAAPGSPLARRTKHEVKTAQRLASRHAQTPILWAKCLLSTSYRLDKFNTVFKFIDNKIKLMIDNLSVYNLHLKFKFSNYVH